jgi:hypothetical protein
MELFRRRKRPNTTAAVPLQQPPPVVRPFSFPYPAWTYALKAPMWVFPSQKSATRVVILPLTVQQRPGVDRAQREREDEEGRLSRAASLHQLDLVMFETDAVPTAIFPVVVGAGPVLFGRPWDAASIAGHTASEAPDFVISGELRRDGRGSVALTVWDVKGAQQPLTVERSGLPAAIGAVTGDIVDALEARGSLRRVWSPNWYAVPEPDLLHRWLTVLAQLFSMGLVRSGAQPREALWGESNILDGLRDLAVMGGEWSMPKVAFLSGLALSRYIGSRAYLSYRDHVLQLIEAETDSRSPFAMMSPVAYRIFDMEDRLHAEFRRLAELGDERYRQWLAVLARPFDAAPP